MIGLTKSILFVLTSHDQINEEHKTGLWFSEFAEPYEIFQEAGFRLTTASIKGGNAPIDPRSLNEETSAKWAELIRVAEQTVAIADVTSEGYDAIFMPGGHGTMFDMPDHPKLQSLIAEFAESDRIVGAVCHGPAALVNVRLSDGEYLVKGRKVTAFTNEEEKASTFDRFMPFMLEDKLRAAGAEFIGKPKWSDHVVSDGKLVTGQNPQSSVSIAHTIVRMLNS